jgi:hypothetical protein
MSPENAPAVEPEEAGMSEISRLTGVFFEPSKAFADIAERPRWFVPLLIVVLASIVFLVVFSYHVGWQGLIEETMNTPRMLQMQPEQRHQTEAVLQRFYPVLAPLGALIAVPVMDLITAGILMGIASGIMSAGIRFKQFFAVACYAGLTAVVTQVLATVVMFLKPPDQFNLRNPIAFNLGAFLDPNAHSKAIYTLASGLDVIAFWGIFLTAVGIKAAAGKKLSLGMALLAACVPWAAMLLLKSAAA